MLLNYISYGIEFGFKTYFTFFERKTRDDFPSRMNQKIFSNFLDRNLVNDNKKLSKKKREKNTHKNYNIDSVALYSTLFINILLSIFLFT